MPVRRLLRRSMPFALAGVTVGLAGGLGACASDEGSSSGGDGAGTADDGRQLAEDRGCMSCHREGGNGIGPAWEGLAGSTRTLEDGSTVVADEAYLRLAITDPGAQLVDGYDIRMPSNNLDDGDVTAIVTYIESLSAPEPSS